MHPPPYASQSLAIVHNIMSASSSTSASTPTNEVISIPDPLALHLSPPATCSKQSSPLLPSRPNGLDVDKDKLSLELAEQELLEEIQLLQSKLMESRQKNTLQKNRRLLRRNPSVSDSLLNALPQLAHNSNPRVAERAPRPRIISVSLRLPRKEDRESIRQQMYDGTLPPKALFNVQNASDSSFVWVGLVDANQGEFEHVYGEEHRTSWRVREKRKSRYVAVDIPAEPLLIQQFELYCEETLWPLLHYEYTTCGAAGVLDELWAAYRVVNQRFAEAISEIYEEGDLIWVHNYHLMLLPRLLREALWYAKIGFFLYTPFPSAELFRILPQRTDLLRGVIGADVIGFHSYDYSKQFVASCTRLLGLDGNPNSIEADPRVGRRCEIGIYPAGIDVRTLKHHLGSKVVKSRVAELRARFEGRKIVVGVDRLDDCFAGIPLKLLAFEKLLIDKPKLLGSVVFIEVAMLSKPVRNVATFRQQQMQINEFVGRVNSSFGTLAFSPVHYITTELCPVELYALMSVGHVCIVSATRAGIDLVPYEWTVCQHAGHKGPIVLSEFSGSAHNFATALHVNPWNVDEMSAKLAVALDMGLASRKMRNDVAYRFVTTHTASLWGFNFLEDLQQSDGSTGTPMMGTPALETASVLHAYIGSSPVSSSNVLSSMSGGFPSPGLHAEKLSNVIRGAFGPSPIIGPLSADQVSARLSDLYIGEGLQKGVVSPLEKLEPSWISPDASNQLRRMKKANLFVLDLDGTLVHFQAIPKLGTPTQHVIDLIQILLDSNAMNFVLIVSSRSRATLSQWLADLDVFLAAEDGAYFRAPGGEWTQLFRDVPSYAYSMHQSPSGPYAMSTKSSSSSADLNLKGSEDVKAEEAADPCDNRKEFEDDIRVEKQAKKSTILSIEDGKHRGSAQSIASLNTDSSFTPESMVQVWKSAVLPVMQHFAERTPGVLVEEGDATLTWHYVDADRDFGLWQARDLYKHLETFLLQSLNIELLSEEGRRRWIKVKPRGVDKATAVEKTLEYIRNNPPLRRLDENDTSKASIDFVLCIGDDRADEGMFEFFRDEKKLEHLQVHCAQSRIFTIRVGSPTTAAKWFLESSARVVELLEELTSCCSPTPISM